MRESAAGRVVIVAARNEAERIGDALDALKQALPEARLLVADDASSDATGEIAMASGAWVVRRGRPHGKGANVGATAQAAIGEFEDATTVLLCDADLGASAGALVPLLEAVESGDCDLAVASLADARVPGRATRFRGSGGFGIAQGYARRAVERSGGARFAAPLSGQRAMRLSTLRDLLPFADGWGMETGMTIDAVRAGLRLKEIELPLDHRVTGRTPAGFLHRARQLRDIRRAVRERGR
jgi:glycosyltransferase involved in cell wall biosynthesis